MLLVRATPCETRLWLGSPPRNRTSLPPPGRTGSIAGKAETSTLPVSIAQAFSKPERRGTHVQKKNRGTKPVARKAGQVPLRFFVRRFLPTSPPFLHCSRSSISTNVGSWLSSKRICWRSPRCRLRRRPSKDRVDVLWPFVGLRTDRLFCIGCVDIAIRVIHSNQTHDARRSPSKRGGKSFGVLDPCMPSRATLDRGDCSQSFWCFIPRRPPLVTSQPMHP